MPKRTHTRKRKRLYRKLVARDGEQCRDCKRSPDTLGEPLSIDHLDEDRTNWDMGNLALRCRACNTAKSNRLRPRRRSESAEGRSALRAGQPGPSGATQVSGDHVCASVWERDNLRPLESAVNGSRKNGHAGVGAPTQLSERPYVATPERSAVSVKQPDEVERPDLESGTPEMVAKAVYERTYDPWLLGKVDALGRLPKKEAIYGGMYVTDASESWIRRRLNALVSGEGPLCEVLHEGKWFIERKGFHADA